jgi:hypothetical protein
LGVAGEDILARRPGEFAGIDAIGVADELVAGAEVIGTGIGGAAEDHGDGKLSRGGRDPAAAALTRSGLGAWSMGGFLVGDLVLSPRVDLGYRPVERFGRFSNITGVG